MSFIDAITPLQYCLLVGPWVVCVLLWTLALRP